MTVGELQESLQELTGAASAILLKLATGGYDPQIEIAGSMLQDLTAAIPQAAGIERAVAIFLAINKATAHVSAVPDGRGGFVPSTNSRIDPRTGKFLPKG